MKTKFITAVIIMIFALTACFNKNNKQQFASVAEQNKNTETQQLLSVKETEKKIQMEDKTEEEQVIENINNDIQDSVQADQQDETVNNNASDVVEIEDDQTAENVNAVIEEINEQQYYKVIKVVDGDTVAVDINGSSETLRLIGIDTPESVHPTKPVECFAIEASNKAKELLSENSVRLESDNTQGERDKYGRLLRYLFLEDGTNFNKLMIKEGYAHEYTYNIPYKYQAEFKEAENYARINELGLWANGACGEENISQEIEVETESPATIQTECECLSNKYNCGDFKTQLEAQSLFECCGGITNDIHRLDRDNDGIVCESLP